MNHRLVEDVCWKQFCVCKMDNAYKLILFVLVFLFECYMLGNKGIVSHDPDLVVSHLFGYNDISYVNANGFLLNKELGTWIVDNSYDSLTVIKDTYNKLQDRSSTFSCRLILCLLFLVRKYFKSKSLPRRYTANYQSNPNYLKSVLSMSNYSLSDFATQEVNRSLFQTFFIYRVRL